MLKRSRGVTPSVTSTSCCSFILPTFFRPSILNGIATSASLPSLSRRLREVDVHLRRLHRRHLLQLQPVQQERSFRVQIPERAVDRVEVRWDEVSGSALSSRLCGVQREPVDLRWLRRQRAVERHVEDPAKRWA